MAALTPPQVPSPAPFGGPKLSTQARVPNAPQTTHVGAPPSRDGRAYYAQKAREAARRYGVPEQLFVAQIQWESGFNPTARGKDGEVGIAQIMPLWRREVDPTNPEQSLDWAAQHMAALYKNLGSWELALAGYNAGGATVKRYKGIPPYAGTQKYVAGIMRMAGMANEGLTGRTRTEAELIRGARQRYGLPPWGSPANIPADLPPATMPPQLRGNTTAPGGQAPPAPGLPSFPLPKTEMPAVSMASLLPQMIADPKADRIAMLIKMLPFLSPQVKAALPKEYQPFLTE